MLYFDVAASRWLRSSMLNSYDFLSTRGDEYKKLSFKDLLFVHYKCPQEERFMKLYTHYNYIVYVLSGKKIYHQPGRTYILDEGSCSFIRKGGINQERFYDEDWVLISFFIPDHYLKSIVREYRPLLPVRPAAVVADQHVLPLNVNDITREYFASIMPYFSQSSPAAEPIVELKFRELLFNLLTNPENSILLAYLDELNDKDGPDLREIMEANYLYNLSLPEYARISHRSLTVFKRDFAAVFRMPPGKWLIEKRLSNAELLLLTSRRPVVDIVESCGFESQTHFNRVFRKKFGFSPLQYRKLRREQALQEPMMRQTGSQEPGYHQS